MHLSASQQVSDLCRGGGPLAKRAGKGPQVPASPCRRRHAEEAWRQRGCREHLRYGSAALAAASRSQRALGGPPWLPGFQILPDSAIL